MCPTQWIQFTVHWANHKSLSDIVVRLFSLTRISGFQKFWIHFGLFLPHTYAALVIWLSQFSFARPGKKKYLFSNILARFLKHFEERRRRKKKEEEERRRRKKKKKEQRNGKDRRKNKGIILSFADPPGICSPSANTTQTSARGEGTLTFPACVLWRVKYQIPLRGQNLVFARSFYRSAGICSSSSNSAKTSDGANGA